MSKKRFRPLGEVISMGLVEDGSLLRYIVRQLRAAEATTYSVRDAQCAALMSLLTAALHCRSKIS